MAVSVGLECKIYAFNRKALRSTEKQCDRNAKIFIRNYVFVNLRETKPIFPFFLMTVLVGVLG